MEERQGRVRNALSGRRESSGGEESVRNAGGSPLKVRSPWGMKRGVFWKGSTSSGGAGGSPKEVWSLSGLKRRFSGR